MKPLIFHLLLSDKIKGPALLGKKTDNIKHKISLFYLSFQAIVSNYKGGLMELQAGAQ